MTNQLEFGSRAALCRQLAKEDPANRALWMAEVESWARLSNRHCPNLRGSEGAQPLPRSADVFRRASSDV